MPRSAHHKYTGRAQYPRIVEKPVVAPKHKGTGYSVSELDNIVHVLNLLQAWIDDNGSDTYHTKQSICASFSQAKSGTPVSIRESIDLLVSDENLSEFLESSEPTDQRALLEYFEKSRDQLFAAQATESNRRWRRFGKEQFAGHAGAMFAYIAREQKQHMSVDPIDPIDLRFQPSQFLGRESDNGVSFGILEGVTLKFLRMIFMSYGPVAASLRHLPKWTLIYWMPPWVSIRRSL